MQSPKPFSALIIKIAQLALLPSAYGITASDLPQAQIFQEEAPIDQQIFSSASSRTSLGLTETDREDQFLGVDRRNISSIEILQHSWGDWAEGCSPGNSKLRTINGKTLGEFVSVRCHGFEVEDIGLWIRFWQDRVTSIKLRNTDLGAIPTINAEYDPILAENELIELHALSSLVTNQNPVWRWIDSNWTLCYRLEDRPDGGLSRSLIVDALSGSILAAAPLGFHMTAKAQVLARNDGSEDLIEAELPDLENSGFLDGKDFQIFAPHDYSPRVRSSEGVFTSSPSQRGEFDQIQSYFNLTNALHWIQTRLGFDMGGIRIKVRTQALIGGLDPNNAEYVPPGAGSVPEIHLGIGSNKIRNLSRDRDVATHEFMHHLVFQYIATRDRNSALALHEGFSDYFTYAITGDPYLAETALPNKPYLRTALLSEERRFDNPYIEKYPHSLGEIWSAMLWQSRSKLGADFDRIVYRSLQYLDETSDFEDALLALFNADRDLNPKPGTDDKMSLFGASQCHLIQAALDRGFVEFIRDMDGSDCGIDLQVELEKNSTRRFTSPAQSDVKEEPTGERLFGIRCAVIGAGQSPALDAWSLLTVLLPIFVGTALPRRRIRNQRAPAPTFKR